MGNDFTAGQKLTAAALNAIFTNMFLENMTQNAVATHASSPGVNTFGDLTGSPGPTCTITSVGTLALVLFGAQMDPSSDTDNLTCTFDVSGATAISATANVGNANYIQNSNAQPVRCIGFGLVEINPGQNIYTMRYRDSIGGSGQFGDRSLMVWAP